MSAEKLEAVYLVDRQFFSTSRKRKAAFSMKRSIEAIRKKITLECWHGKIYWRVELPPRW